jgi:5-methylcytosine-specific restriction enzyme subunit McrC
MRADERPGERRIGRIPVRNLWLLMLYASDLLRTREIRDVLTDEAVDDLPDLIARLLADCVELRLRRNLTRGYRRREAVVARVRGRVEILTTEAHLLLAKGQVFCRFEELTIDTPRNRLVRAALDRLARFIRSTDLAQRCRSLASSLARAGVGGARPARADIARDQIGRNDSADRNMVALAELAFDLALPTEDPGATSLGEPDREETWVRRLFEKAVLGFARVELEPLGWRVRGGVHLDWQVSGCSSGLTAILPRMVTEIVLDDPKDISRLVIDTKFAAILTRGRFGDTTLKSDYLYQMYAYLRSQEGLDPLWGSAAGLLLHPAIEARIHENVTVQNHPLTFATVDLGGAPSEIRRELRRILRGEQEDLLAEHRGNHTGTNVAV